MSREQISEFFRALNSFTLNPPFSYICVQTFCYGELTSKGKTIIQASGTLPIAGRLSAALSQFKKIVDDDAVMRELEAIINFAMPKMKESLDEGALIYEFVESQCEIFSVELASQYAKEGYMFLSRPSQTEVKMLCYTVTIFSQSHESMRGIHTLHIGTAPRSISHILEKAKLELIRKFTDLPNPSTYLITSKLKFWFAQTLMPVAKRILVKHISKAA